MPNKGQGNGRGRGRGRGRGGKRSSKELFPAELPSHSSPVPGPSTRTYEEEKEIDKGQGNGRGRGRGRGRGGKRSSKELFPAELPSHSSPIPGPSTRTYEEEKEIDKGQGNGRERGRGRGRGGKRSSNELFPAELPSHSSPVPGPSTRTYEEEKQIVLKSLAQTKKRVRDLTPEARNVYVGKKRARHLERFLLPDAPPRKQLRKISPTRSTCRLGDNIPTTPPARKLMPWEIIEPPALTSTRPTESTPPHDTAHDWGTPTSTVSLDSVVEVPGYSPLRVDWSTGNLKASNRGDKEHPASPPPPSPRTVASLMPGPSTDKKLKKTKCTKIITGLDYGTKKADDIFENWCRDLEDDSDKDDDEEVEKPLASIDINSEAASLPVNIPEETQAWLHNEDAEADRTIRQMLPIEHLTFDWSCDPTTFTGQREGFTASPGPTFTLNDETTPLSVFSKFFDDDLIDLIVRQTNKYSNILVDRITTENSRLLNWKNTDREEVFVFLAILILQGLAPLNVEYDYWKENGYLTLKYFKDLMPYNRFVLMKRLLHFSDNQTDLTGLSSAQRKLRKIWPVLDDLNKKFSQLYIPSQNVAIDESLLKWHGRLSFAQKIATKAAKVGVKSYELCESDTGYLWSFFVYTGKGEKIGPDVTDNDHTDMTDDVIDLTDINALTDNDGQMTDNQQTTTSAPSLPPPPQNATAQIVHVLAKPLLGKGYTLIMDNFYNSPLLTRYLKSQKTDCFGTLRVNREFVPEAIKGLAKTEMRVGEVVQSFSHDMSVMLWRDTNVVSMISTYHTGEVSGKEKYGRYKYKPEIVCDYNLAMGGVDKKDQLLSAHPIERSRNMAWYKKVFRRLLNVTIHNAFVIFKSQNPSITSRAFRQRLADEMIMAYKSPRIQSTVLVKPKYVIQYQGGQRPILQGNHFIGQGVAKNARCVWCRQSRTKYACKQCQVALCLEVCFEEYHTKH